MLSKEEVDRLFEKRSKVEEEVEASRKKRAEDSRKREWQERAWRKREFPTGALAECKYWSEGRRYEKARAQFEATQIQKRLKKWRKQKYWEVIKEGVLEGAIRVHETDEGFAIDTSPEQVEEYLRRNPKSKDWFSESDCLKDGSLLLGTSHEIWGDKIMYVRDGLIEEFQASSPSDLMLIDFLTSNYFRAMNATRTEFETFWYASDFNVETFEIIHQGLQRYIHDCQNQLLRVLSALQSRRQSLRGSTFTHETYTRTDINLESWGLPLLLALADITEKKEQGIGIDEIKSTMARYMKDVSPETIPNNWIGYALRRFGFIEKVHVTEGNRYNIERQRVLTLLSEELKG